MARVRDSLRARWAVVGTIVVAAFVAFAVVPVFGSETPDVDRLRMTDSSGDLFIHGDPVPAQADTVQALNTKRCALNPASGPIASFTAEGPGRLKGPGIFDHGMGVKTGNSNGTPCSEAEDGETLIITSTSAAWSKLRLDVEAKGDAWIMVELSGGGFTQTHQLLTGGSIAAYNQANGKNETPANTYPYTAVTTSTNKIEACANPNDSGPDSNINDNCLWAIDPGAAFNTVKIWTAVGSMSLEGGNDYEAFDAPGLAAGLYDSLFYRLGPPTANDDSGDDYRTNEDEALSTSPDSVLDNDSPALTGGMLTAVLDSGPSNGMLTSFNPDGTFAYLPNLNWHGIDTFTYRAIEGGQQSAPATVTIIVDPVNDAPVAVDGPLSATEDVQETYSGDELAIDIDSSSSALVVISASANNGTATVVNGEVVYTPADDFCGTDVVTLTFVVSDGALDTGESTVTIDVSCIADDDSYSMDEREEVADVVDFATLTVPVAGVLANDSDSPGDLTASDATTPTSGGSVSLASDGSFTYTPGPHTWSGNDTSYQDIWQYTADYGGGDTQTATVTITVNRNLCQTDTVTDVDGDIFGSFTLLFADGCKNWVPAVADDEEDTVVFQPDTPDTTGVYDGTLRIENLVVEYGDLAPIILKWTSTPEIPASYDVIDSCDDLDPDPDIVDPVLPGNPPNPSGWCFYDLDPVLTGAQIWTVTWRVRGWDDPGFRFK